MGLFDFMKKNDAKTNSEKKPAESKEKYENPANLVNCTINVECDQIPYHDPGVDMDVKLLVRAEFYLKGEMRDEAEIKEAAIQSFKDAFAQIDGQVPAREFTKSANMNMLKKAMRESMVAQGFDVVSVMLNWMSYNKEYRELIDGKKPYL